MSDHDANSHSHPPAQTHHRHVHLESSHPCAHIHHHLPTVDVFKQGHHAIRRALALIAAFVGVEFLGAYWSNSLALMGDALHLLGDVGALFFSFVAAWVAAKNSHADLLRAKKIEALGALIGTVIIWVVTAFMLHEAYERFQDPPEVKGGAMFVISLMALVVNTWSLRILHGAQMHSLNARAVYLHVLGDLLSSVVTVVAGAVIWATGLKILDPILTCVFAGFILWSSFLLARETLHSLKHLPPN